MPTSYPRVSDAFKGRPIAQRPPAQVTINSDDGVITMAENVLNEPQAGHYADAPINPSTTEKMN